MQQESQTSYLAGNKPLRFKFTIRNHMVQWFCFLGTVPSCHLLMRSRLALQISCSACIVFLQKLPNSFRMKSLARSSLLTPIESYPYIKIGGWGCHSPLNL